MPVHGFEYFVIYMLDGNIQIFYDLGVLRDLVNKLVVKLVRIGVVQPYPLNTVYLAYSAAELGKASLAVEVSPVAGYVLRDDDDLLDTVRSQITCFLNDVFELSRAVPAAYVRYRTKGAEVIAALGNTQIRP